MNARRPAAEAPASAGTAPGGAAHHVGPRTSWPVLPLTIDAGTMAAALTDGSAVPLTPTVTGIVAYQGQWWLDDDDAWLLITDEAFTAALDERRTSHGRT
jgi:hypothetical protein